MMKKIYCALLVLSLVACNNQQSQELPQSDVVAIVGEEKITVDLLNAFLRANGVSQTDEAIITKALDALIEEIAVANIAKKENIELNKEQLNTLKYLQIKSLSNNAKQDYLLKESITDYEVQAEYDKGQKQTGDTEYHVHHLLYKDEVQAIKQRETITSVDAYKAKEIQFQLENPGIRGVGDLGWVSISHLPESFWVPLQKVQENTVLEEVLNSQFGAHIVYLAAKRPLQPPKLADVKQGIINALQAKKISKFVQLAKAKAHVQVKKKK